MRVVQAPNYRESRDAVSHDWLQLLAHWGLSPLLVPNVSEDPVAHVRESDVEALLLTNGDDVSPARYGEPEIDDYVYAHERDRTEVSLLAWALESNLPVLGACRGLHLINVHFGGRISHHIESAPGGLDHVVSNHAIKVVDEKFATRFGSHAEVNSYHRHGITADDLGEKLIPFATADDGIVEGVYIAGKPLLAIQWHPERPGPESSYHQELARQFLREGQWW